MMLVLHKMKKITTNERLQVIWSWIIYGSTVHIGLVRSYYELALLLHLVFKTTHL